MLGVSLLGAGRVAERHAGAITAAGDHVTAIVDPAESARDRLASRVGGVPSFGSLDDLFASGLQSDVAIVASPSAEHRDQAVALLRRGTAVLIEKPHRLPHQPGGPLLAAVAEPGAVAQVGMTTRFSAGFLALRAAVASGELGRVEWVEDRIWFGVAGDDLASWYFDPDRSGGGVLVTNGVHAIDRVGWLLDEPLHLRHAELWTLVGGRPVEDGARVDFGTASGARVTVSLLWAPYDVPSGDLRVVGSSGTGSARPDGSWEITRADGTRCAGAPEPEGAPFARQWAAFRATVDGGDTPEPGVATVERALAHIEAIYARR